MLSKKSQTINVNHFVNELINFLWQEVIKGATKSYFTNYSFVVIVLFNTALCRSAFSTVFFIKLVFLSFCAFFESRYLNMRHHAM